MASRRALKRLAPTAAIPGARAQAGSQGGSRGAGSSGNSLASRAGAVSYTHLDVYKRQVDPEAEERGRRVDRIRAIVAEFQAEPIDPASEFRAEDLYDESGIPT